MYPDELRTELAASLEAIRNDGLFKRERELTTAQGARVATASGTVLNFCANNYLGLADHPDVVVAAKAALDEWGFGMASVRFICGTQTLHTDAGEAPLASSSAPRTRSCSPAASTPTAAPSRCSSARGTRSSPTS